MRNVVLVVHSAGVGGVEKRFHNLYRHISSLKENSRYRYTFLFNRRFLSMINMKEKVSNNRFSKIIKYGLGRNMARLVRINILVRMLDLLLLGILLLKLKYSTKIDIIHFVTTTSLKYRFMFSDTAKVASFYNGAFTKQEVTHDKSYKKIFKDDIYFDCLSPSISKILIEEGKAPPGKIFTSPCSFIDIRGTYFEPKIKANMVCFVGRFDKQKGIDLLLRSMGRIITCVPDIKICIVGHGPLDKDIRDFVSQKKLENNVNIFFHPNPKEILLHSLIFLSLQYNENYPSQSLLEAMACGNAIVATNVGLTNLLVDDTNGILIQEHDDRQLAESVIKMIQSKDETLLKCRKSRQRVIKNHSVERFLNYLNGYYDSRLN